MDLIIVESPTKARTLSRFLGNKFRIDATMGHIQDLPKNKLGVDVENDFQPDYVAVKKKGNIVKTIKEDARKVDNIYIATDPDREGEAIAYHVARLVEGKKTNKTKQKQLHRVVFHEITEGAVKHALENPREIDIALFHAQQARRILDRLVGYKLSPLLWKKIRKGLSAGRVQSVAVRLIVEREREIEDFKPVEYWEIYAKVKGEEEFSVKLVRINKDKAIINNNKQADEILHALKSAQYKVSSIDKKEISKSPPPPYTTSTMTQAASSNYSWSAKKTMSIAQRLYEEGLITYHRTDSTFIASEAISAVRVYIEKVFGKPYLPFKPRLYKTKSKVAQEAHEAIRPASVTVKNSNQSVIALGNDAEKLYTLIWRRFVATQMSLNISDQTTITVEAISGENKYYLQAGGQIIKFDGWRAVYPKKESIENGEVYLPRVDNGELLTLLNIDPQQKFTEPPARYTEASLVKILEKLGIGRPSTYAPTISTIQDRLYIEKSEGKFFPTSLGSTVNKFLIEHFPDVFEYSFTAQMEEHLDEIANGEKKWVPIIHQFWDPFSVKLNLVEESAARIKIEVESTGEKCPKCVKDMLPGQDYGEQVVRTGKFGKFLSCSRFPDCNWKAPFVEKVNIACPNCKIGEVIIKKTRAGKKFFGCLRYPDCKYASWKKPQKLNQDAEKSTVTVDKVNSIK